MAEAKYVSWVADFEATTKVDESGRVRVWGWGAASCDMPESDVIYGHTLSEFIDMCETANRDIWFHNLKYDGNFIISWLLENGYTALRDKGRETPPGTFRTLVSEMMQFYEISVTWKSGTKTRFKDSLKKLPFSIREIAGLFELSDSKGDIDYHLDRPMGYLMSSDEREYIRRDVEILRSAMVSTLNSGGKKLTLGSDSMGDFMSMIGKDYRRLFPVLSIPLDNEIRKAYRGGFTYANPRYSGQVIRRKGSVYDVNSMYPYVMRNLPLPTGYPALTTEPVSGKLNIFSVTFTAKLKKNHIPCIQVKGSSRFSPTEYVTKITEPTTLVVTDVDFELYKEQYDIEIHSINGNMAFDPMTGIFAPYIDKWMSVKERSTGPTRLLAKLRLNSLYGKFATNPVLQGKYPELVESGEVKYSLSAPEYRDPVYTPVGVYITSHARAMMVRTAQANYENFAYCDTDSMHMFTTNVNGIEIDSTRLGAWKHETDFEAALYMRAKAYAELLPDGSYDVHIAGLPRHIASQQTFETLQRGAVFSGKLRPKNVPGGVLLVDVPYVLDY